MSSCCCSSQPIELEKKKTVSSDCCSEPASQPNAQTNTTREFCPNCGEKGKKVGIKTLQSMLSISLESIQHESNYRFCRSQDCSTVYFAETGTLVFTEEQLREKVYQKHPNRDETHACYCFQHTIGSIKAELQEKGMTDVVERVTKETKVGTCACDIRNPQGSCCLGNLRKAVKHAKDSLSQS